MFNIAIIEPLETLLAITLFQVCLVFQSLSLVDVALYPLHMLKKNPPMQRLRLIKQPILLKDLVHPTIFNDTLKKDNSKYKKQYDRVVSTTYPHYTLTLSGKI